MRLNEIYTKYNYTPPAGGIECRANVDVILNNLFTKGFTKDTMELNREEFVSVFSALKDEILVSMLLNSNQKRMNDYWRDGIDIRGIVVKMVA